MKIEKKENFQSFHLIWVDEIDSTNTYLKTNYNLFEEYIVLIAKKQTQGRGRYNRIWESNNDLCFSILWKKHQRNAILAPLAIIEALKDFSIDAQIKWPNDILLNGKKLCGILIEDIYEESFLASVVGMGINLEDKPSVDGVGVLLDKEELLKGILLNYERLLNISLNECMTLYKKYSLVIGKYVHYEGHVCLVKDINLDGSLCITFKDGTIKNIYSNEIDIKNAMI